MVESPFAGHFTIKINTHLQFIYSPKDDQGPLTIKVHWCVVSTPLKNMSSSDWIIIPNLVGEHKLHVPVTTTSPIFHQMKVQFSSFPTTNTGAGKAIQDPRSDQLR